MPLRIRPSKIGRFSQWLQRTSRWCFFATSTPTSSGGLLVEFDSQSSDVELRMDLSLYCLALADAGMKRNILFVTSVPFASFSVAAYTTSPLANVTGSGATCVTGTFAGTEIVLEPS